MILNRKFLQLIYQCHEENNAFFSHSEQRLLHCNFVILKNISFLPLSRSAPQIVNTYFNLQLILKKLIFFRKPWNSLQKGTIYRKTYAIKTVLRNQDMGFKPLCQMEALKLSQNE